MDLAQKLCKQNKPSLKHYQNAKRKCNKGSKSYVVMDTHKETFSIYCCKLSKDQNYYEKRIKASSSNVIKHPKFVKKLVWR